MGNLMKEKSYEQLEARISKKVAAMKAASGKSAK